MANVLIIDDAPEVRNVLADILASGGHTCRTAADALIAAQMLEGERFDVVITDIFMPVIDGLELLQLWRQEHPRIRFITMSGGGTTATGRDVLVEARERGSNIVLEKPVAPSVLLAAVESVT